MYIWLPYGIHLSMAMTQKPMDWRYLFYVIHMYGLFFRPISREYTHKIWSYIVQYLSVLGSWNSRHGDFDDCAAKKLGVHWIFRETMCRCTVTNVHNRGLTVSFLPEVCFWMLLVQSKCGFHRNIWNLVGSMRERDLSLIYIFEDFAGTEQRSRLGLEEEKWATSGF